MFRGGIVVALIHTGRRVNGVVNGISNCRYNLPLSTLRPFTGKYPKSISSDGSVVTMIPFVTQESATVGDNHHPED